MGMSERFRQQYQSNLNEYRRQAPRRFLRLLIALVLAIVVGASLHFTKNIPILFYFFVIIYGLIAVVCFFLKVLSLFRLTYDETRYIVLDKTPDDVPTDLADHRFPPHASGATHATPVSTSASFPWASATELPLGSPPMPVAEPARGGAGKVVFLTLGCLSLMMCAGCLGVPLLVVPFLRQPAPQRPAPFAEPNWPVTSFPNRAEENARRMEERARQLEEQVRRHQEAVRRDLEQRRAPGR